MKSINERLVTSFAVLGLIQGCSTGQNRPQGAKVPERVAQKISVVEAMWEVAFADNQLDANEHHVISKVAGLLHVTHGEYIAAKLHAQAAAQG